MSVCHQQIYQDQYRRRTDKNNKPQTFETLYIHYCIV